MMLFFELFIRKILESQVLRNGRTTVTVRQSEANRVPLGRGVDALLRTGRLRASLQFLVRLTGSAGVNWLCSGESDQDELITYFDGCSKGLLVFVV